MSLILVVAALQLSAVGGGSIVQAGNDEPNCSDGEFKAYYFNNSDLSGAADTVRCEDSVSNSWGDGAPADTGLAPDQFSVRWIGEFEFRNGMYTFFATTDDGMRVWLEDELVIDQWQPQAATFYAEEVDTRPGTHTVTIEYREDWGNAVAEVTWAKSDTGECSKGSFQASYYDNAYFSGAPRATRCEQQIDHDWGTGAPAETGLGDDTFTVRWEGEIKFERGDYTFVASTDDGMRIWLDGALILDEWRGQPVTTYSTTVTVQPGFRDLKIEYYEDGGDAVASVSWGQATAPVCSNGSFQASYFANDGFNGVADTVRCESGVNYDWGTGSPEGTGLGADNFSVRWIGNVKFEKEDYTFTASTDDGMRVWLDNLLVINEWRGQPVTTFSATISVTPGFHTVTVEYYEDGGEAVAQVSWTPVASGVE